MGLQIYANIDATGLQFGRVQSATDLRPKAFREFPIADSTAIDLYLTGQDGELNIQDYPSIQLGVGSLAGRPSSGTWKMLVGAETPLAFDAAAAALESVISTDINPCTVQLLAPYVYKVKFDSFGEQTLPSVDATDLNPNSSANISIFVSGDATTKEEWLIRLFKNPLALTNSWTNTNDGGVRGNLALGTAGIYQLLGSNSSVTSTLELELTDIAGNITTIFQVQIKIIGEVIGQGATGVAAFGTYATYAALAAAETREKFILVSEAGGSDSTGLREREDRAFATPSAAVAVAVTGDMIIIRDGNFSGDNITIPDGVTIVSNPTAIGPLCSSIGTSEFTLIGPFTGLNHESTGAATLAAVDMLFVNIQNTDGSVSISNSILSSNDAIIYEALRVTGGGQIRIDNCRITNSNAGQAAAKVTSFAGSLILSECQIKSSTPAEPIPADGIQIVSALTGSIQLKNCTIISTSSIADDSAAIRTDTACTVQVQGSLNANLDVGVDVTLQGGMINTDTTYDI